KKIKTNKLNDVFGLQTVKYSYINPMLKVMLSTILNIKLSEINSQESSLTNMANYYFNAVWQDIDRLLDIDLGSMRIVKDTEGGVFDGSTGEVIKATSFNVGSYTDLDRSEEHTSELQSRFDLVCRLLLEKKNIMK